MTTRGQNNAALDRNKFPVSSRFRNMSNARLERQIEASLRPDRFVPEGDSFDFVEGLEKVRRSIGALLPKEATRATVLYETFLAGCAAKADQVDHSYERFGEFIQDLVCDWVRARRAASMEAAETVGILLRWEKKDDTCFFDGIERRLLATFNRGERSAYLEAIRARFDEELKKAEGPGRPHPFYDAPFPLREATDVLKTLYEASGNVSAYEGLCRIMGVSPKDCERIAKLLKDSGKPAEALEWAQQGLDPDRRKQWPNQDAWNLDDLKRGLLKELGRNEEALEDAWNTFRRQPGEFSHEELMRYVPPPDRADWHQKAMEIAESGDLGSCLDLFVKVRDWARLALRVRRSSEADIQALYYSRAIEAAKKLKKVYPVEAAALYQGQAVQILNEKKSRLYGSAVRYLAEARRCYEEAGQNETWRGLSDRLLQEHARKSAFLEKFKPVASGVKPVREPSFLARAKKRWTSDET